MSNLKVYVDSFRGIYSINNGVAANASVATGRYPEDVYYGGNVSAFSSPYTIHLANAPHTAMVFVDLRRRRATLRRRHRLGSTTRDQRHFHFSPILQSIRLRHRRWFLPGINLDLLYLDHLHQGLC